MKLTEQQLQKLFQNNSMHHQAQVAAGDCLQSSEASSQRLQQAEDLLNDYTSAQAMKAAFASKDWAKQIAHSVKDQSVGSWFNWLAHPFKATITATAFAMTLFVALPNLSHKEQEVLPTQVQNDIINSAAFESDVLSSASFDESKDALFNGSFG